MAQAQAPKLFPDIDAAADALTPLMAQYKRIKAEHDTCLVFFRLGDFYELFFDDAVKASSALDIALTRRGQFQGRDIPMCGIPAHSCDGYLAKLIRKGFRVAICEQTENPLEAKKRGPKSIVTREVVRIVTPGTLTEDTLLDARAANNLACLASVGDEIAISWLDLTSGQPYTQSLSLRGLSTVLGQLDASEILLSQRLVDHSDFQELLAPWSDRLVPQPPGRFESVNATHRLQAIYKVNELQGFGDFTRAEVTALGALLDYVDLTQKTDLTHLARPERVAETRVLAIDASTRRNLELTRTLHGQKQGSLLDTIDCTLTGSGARLLCQQLVSPSMDVSVINHRLDAVGYALEHKATRDAVRGALRHVPDLERCLSRLALLRGGPRDLAAVRDSLRGARIIGDLLAADKDQLPAGWPQHIRALTDHATLEERLSKALSDELPLQARDGNFIARGFSQALDELVVLRDDSRRLIAGLQQTYIDACGASALKIRHNQVLGYYIEVTPLHADKLLSRPDLFIHRQTLATAARFTTIELGELERKITEAADRALALELEHFSDLVRQVVSDLPQLREAAVALATLDVSFALAHLAEEQSYVRPVVDASLEFNIQAGRHPVVEQMLRTTSGSNAFIANDCNLAASQRLWLLTGPNMAGKSTFLRQNALIAVMAQMGSFVPARHAHLGVIDRLFSRVGASDDLARGHSTFMVEMIETAAILNQATDRSLVILDEIGRGTATYDGLSIAWATVEHLHEISECRALFATHYHELTHLASRLGSLSCHTMRIKEWNNNVVFLHEVIEGVADRSYGIHVARMAGLPVSVLARAEDVLRSLEAANAHQHNPTTTVPPMSRLDPPAAVTSPTEIDTFLATLLPDDMTPKDALRALYALKALARS